MDIRHVTVELFRAGPPHNQLLSPLTQYLGACGDSPTTQVTFPYEHAAFLRRLQDLSYRTDDDLRRVDAMNQTGRELAQILSSIHGVSGVFTNQGLRRSSAEIGDQLIHFRLVLSASELAMLPFELTKLLDAADQPSGHWLTVQNPVPVCMTRRVRSVRTQYDGWPTKVKVLFVAADPQDLPYEDHRNALQRALEPWIGSEGDINDWVETLPNARLVKSSKNSRATTTPTFTFWPTET